MKKCTILRLIMTLGLALPLLAACACGASKNGTDPAAAVAGVASAEARLLGGLYVLQSVNGAPVAWERQPEIEFSEGLQISGQVCNRFIGPAAYKNGVLTVPQMAMTMMLCIDDRLNQLERDFALMLREGARLSLANDTLTLSGGGLTLVYRRR